MSDLDNLKFEIQDENLGGTRIKVVGVGGGGSNAVGRMIQSGVAGVEFYIMNTDAQALRNSSVPNKIPLGTRITHGLGAGSDPEVGRQAALEDTDRILEVLEGADMVFIAAGLGGGTGTGAAPVVASLAKELGALTVAVVTRPFRFEGPRRLNQAQKGLAEIAATVDTVISIPNDRLVELVPADQSFFEAFKMADDILRQGVQGISDIITTPGLINRDFADVKAIMTGMGFAMMGTASAHGDQAAIEAAKLAIQCPLLEEGGIEGARAILMNISGSAKLTLHDIHRASELIRAAAGNDEVQINFGLVYNEKLADEVKVTVIATGFQRQNLPEIDRSAAPQIGKRISSGVSVAVPSKAVPSRPVVTQSLLDPEPELPVREAAMAPLEDRTESITLDIVPEPDFEHLIGEPIAVEPPAPAPPPAPRTPPPPQSFDNEEEVLDFGDLDTPGFLRRERKLFK